jgi:hypothetical protein
MRLRLQFGGLLIALGICAAVALPCAAQKPRTNWAAQNRESNKPPKQQKPPKQAERPPRAGGGRNTTARPSRPTENTNVNRPPRRGGETMQGPQGPSFNANRPPNANRPQANVKRFQDLSPEEKQKVLRNRDMFNRLPPQRQQEMREAARNWQRLTPEQQNHIRSDVLPKWRQMPPDRQRAIRQRLGVLQNMPESARNQHLNDPNFTRGMSEEDKAMLRDLSHMHVGGAPEPPSE